MNDPRCIKANWKRFLLTLHFMSVCGDLIWAWRIMIRQKISLIDGVKNKHMIFQLSRQVAPPKRIQSHCRVNKSKIKISRCNYVELLTSRIERNHFRAEFKVEKGSWSEQLCRADPTSLFTMRMARKYFRKRKRLYFAIFFAAAAASFNVWITISKAQVLNGFTKREQKAKLCLFVNFFFAVTVKSEVQSESDMCCATNIAEEEQKFCANI